MLNEKKMHETEVEMLDAYLGDSFTFSVSETARKLKRSRKWVLDKTASGKLRFIWLDGQKAITRPTLVEVLTEGI